MSINLSDEQLKILILFSLRSAVSPIPQSTLGEILGICDINYFNIVPVLDEVVESGLVGRYETEDGIFLSLSEKSQTQRRRARHNQSFDVLSDGDAGGNDGADFSGKRRRNIQKNT